MLFQYYKMGRKKIRVTGDSRAKFSVSSSSLLVFNEVLLEAALFVAALSVMYRTTQHNQHSDQKMERINEKKNEKTSINEKNYT